MSYTNIISVTNAQHQVREGDVWAYYDADDGRADDGWVLWRIHKLYRQPHSVEAPCNWRVDLEKQTGRNVGFIAMGYDVTAFSGNSWKWVSGTADRRVTYACPRCGEDELILTGDYVCTKCRQTLDTADVGL